MRAHTHRFGLFWRVFAVNGVILLIAFALLVLTPITISSPTTTDQLIVLSAGLIVMLVANAALLRASLTPLRRLADQMRTVDVLDRGERLERSGTAEVATVIEAFNAALDRLEDERRASTRRVLFAQEAERRRIAQELHDQIGQDLTAVVLELKRVQAGSRPRRPRRWPMRRSWRARASRTCVGSATSCGRSPSTTSACPARSPRCAPTSPGAPASTSSSTARPGRCRRSTATRSWRSTGSPRSR